MDVTIEGTQEEVKAFFSAWQKRRADTPITHQAVCQAVWELEKNSGFSIKHSFISSLHVCGKVRKIWIEFQSS